MNDFNKIGTIPAHDVDVWLPRYGLDLIDGYANKFGWDYAQMHQYLYPRVPFIFRIISDFNKTCAYTNPKKVPHHF